MRPLALQSALDDLSHSAAKAHHGGNEQLFGAESQDPHAGLSYEKTRDLVFLGLIGLIFFHRVGDPIGPNTMMGLIYILAGVR